MAGDRFVHRIVDHFGEQVMEAVGVGAADIHARPTPHRLEPLEHFDRGGVVFGFAAAAARAGRTLPGADLRRSAVAPPKRSSVMSASGF